TLLGRAVPGGLDARVRDRIVAETGGNPLALLDLPRNRSAAELAGGFELPATTDLSRQLEHHYLQRAGELPEATQRLLLLAAAVGVDEEVAAELERSADRARARGGAAAAAAFLARATELTPDPAERGRRAVAAAQAKFDAGASDAALELLAAAELAPLDELQRARLERVRAQIAFERTRGSDAPAQLLDAARRLEPLDAAMARETHLEAIAAAMFAGRLAGKPDVRELAEAA